MSVNKNKPNVDVPMVMEPHCDQSRAWAVARSDDDAAQCLIVLDDIAPAATAPRSLNSGDRKLWRALQSILEKRQANAWMDEMKARIATELEWSE